MNHTDTEALASVLRFSRDSGEYRAQSTGHNGAVFLHHLRPLNKTMSLMTVARASARREPSRDHAKSEMIRSVRWVS